MSQKPSDKKSKVLAEHFFRLEYAKIVAVITPYFGLNQINLAEDIVQDTLLEAIRTWEFNGIPEDPSAWLYKVAKNKSVNALKRIKLEDGYRSSIESESLIEGLNFSEEQIADDQLRMMFACCDPSISQEAQICLILKTLCGLSIGEIANAFLTNNETINKRLVRARSTLRKEQITFELPNADGLNERLETVLRTIFLLFNEGYSTSKGKQLINYDICLETIRLVELICNHSLFEDFAKPHALLALMLLNAARFQSRVDSQGLMIRLEDQDRSLWNRQLINRGLAHLNKIQGSKEISIYHILATISAYHCVAKEFTQTNWQGILQMYDTLLTVDASPLVRLNRAIALSEIYGPEKGIEEIEQLSDSIPHNYIPFHTGLADLYIRTKDFRPAIKHLKKALSISKSPFETKTIQHRIEECEKELK
ncbi:hypothetical protein BFP97_03615 [Roseivirga sp. 4D4]|uniref:RNA polymerase sigma factor n=1 Tax=Roseivirga sp. 4D4 TaxID=1889784 RepID=UPI0008536923|nr:sigma-70 family RNA polymerase sigma factor [Roseivirga sp. 4D4]OEK00648.1 hypothetical protein BFP97_03615 [Roseivirga sp. 4D4]